MIIDANPLVLSASRSIDDQLVADSDPILEAMRQYDVSEITEYERDDDE